MHKRIMILFLVLMVTGLSVVFAEDKVKVESFEYPDVRMKADVFAPAQLKGKLPVAFLAHNGGGKKEDWGAFPRDLAGMGWLVVSIGWVNMGGTADVTKAIDKVLDTYGAVIDTKRVALVGGCHGAAKFLNVLGDEAMMKKMTVKTVVAMSVSEADSSMLKAAARVPVPMLVMYSTRDPYGYTNINKKFAELIREPKKVLALEKAPHGNEMLMNKDTKANVTREIVGWLKKYVL